MHREFKERYAERGRQLSFMGFPIDDMEVDDLHAVIGFLLDRSSHRKRRWVHRSPTHRRTTA